MRTQTEIVADMRVEAGSRQKLASIAGVSVSTAQAWEKDERPPEGPSLSLLYRWRPELTRELMAALAAARDLSRAAEAAGEG